MLFVVSWHFSLARRAHRMDLKIRLCVVAAVLLGACSGAMAVERRLPLIDFDDRDRDWGITRYIVVKVRDTDGEIAFEVIPAAGYRERRKEGREQYIEAMREWMRARREARKSKEEFTEKRPLVPSVQKASRVYRYEQDAQEYAETLQARWDKLMERVAERREKAAQRKEEKRERAQRKRKREADKEPQDNKGDQPKKPTKDDAPRKDDKDRKADKKVAQKPKSQEARDDDLKVDEKGDDWLNDDAAIEKALRDAKELEQMRKHMKEEDKKRAKEEDKRKSEEGKKQEGEKEKKVEKEGEEKPD